MSAPPAPPAPPGPTDVLLAAFFAPWVQPPAPAGEHQPEQEAPRSGALVLAAQVLAHLAAASAPTPAAAAAAPLPRTLSLQTDRQADGSWALVLPGYGVEWHVGSAGPEQQRPQLEALNVTSRCPLVPLVLTVRAQTQDAPAHTLVLGRTTTAHTLVAQLGEPARKGGGLQARMGPAAWLEWHLLLRLTQPALPLPPPPSPPPAHGPPAAQAAAPPCEEPGWMPIRLHVTLAGPHARGAARWEADGGAQATWGDVWIERRRPPAVPRGRTSAARRC